MIQIWWPLKKSLCKFLILNLANEISERGMMSTFIQSPLALWNNKSIWNSFFFLLWSENLFIVIAFNWFCLIIRTIFWCRSNIDIDLINWWYLDCFIYTCSRYVMYNIWIVQACTKHKRGHFAMSLLWEMSKWMGNNVLWQNAEMCCLILIFVF